MGDDTGATRGLTRAPEHRLFTARLDCRYLLHAPERIDERTLLAVTLHGYGSGPEAMLPLTLNLLGRQHVVAAIAAPSQFFLGSGPDSGIGYSWATRHNYESWVRLHHDMVQHVFEEVGRECAMDVDRRLLIGFSQPVGLNYRLAGTRPKLARGVIGICGGVPKNWEEGPYEQVAAALLHIARREDEFYPAALSERFPERLRAHAGDVEFHMLEGGHRIPSKAGPLIQQWIERVFRGPNS